MRGRSSTAKARLRSAGYKCYLCGRRLIDAASLKRHQKTIHNMTIKSKPPAVRSKPMKKEKEKIFTNLRKEHVLEQAKDNLKINKNNSDNDLNNTLKVFAGEGKTMINKKADLVENGESKEKDKSKKIDKKDTLRQIQFECPVCAKSFNVYFNAHKHIQKAHLLEFDKEGLRPIRVEKCYRCNKMMRSDEEHTCPKNIEEPISVISEFVCLGCNQIFVSLKSFDVHVAGLHSDAVDSMFFPSKLEFMTWRLEMERETNAKYRLYGEYDSKKIYRCSYARTVLGKYTAYFCPSTIVVQEYSKGIQVHFYNKHFDHTSNPYTLASKYSKYSITWFLKGTTNTKESLATAAEAVKVDDRELFPQFKKLMDSIVTNATDVDISVLKKLIEKALEMSAIVTEVAANETTVKTSKTMSDKEITEELGMKTDVEKRRRSVDSYEAPLQPAKRMRNKSLFNQRSTKMSPKIVNTFSLASNSSNSEDDFDSLRDNTETEKPIQNKNKQDSNTVTPKYTRMSTRLSGLSESLSFNDSYKDFIGRNFITKSDGKKETKTTKNTVKTRLGEFKQVSPRQVEIKDTNETPVVNRRLRALLTNKGEVEETSPSTNTNQTVPLNSNVSIETSDITINKVSSPKTDTLTVTNSQSTPKVNPLKTNSFSQSVDPLQTTFNRNESSPIESKVSKVNTRNISPLVDPLELNITKSKPGTASATPLSQRNIAKANSSKIISSPLIDPLQITKINTKVDPIRNAPKVYSGPKMNSPGTPKIALKVTPQILPKLAPKITPKGTPKITPKVTFEDEPATSSATLTPPKKIKEIEYEVREQENDCNILVLKF